MSARRRLSARARVAIATTVTLAATVAVLVVVAYMVTLLSLRATVDRELEREVSGFVGAVGAEPSAESSATLEQATRDYLGAHTGAAGGTAPVLIVVFSDGRILSNSDVRLELAPDNSGVKDPPTKASSFDFVYQAESYRAIAVPVLDPDGRRQAVFEAAVSTAAVQGAARLVAIALGLAGLAALAIGTGVSLWSAGKALVPLQRMAADAADITHAEPGRRITYRGPADEVGSLANSLNSMLDRLEAGAEEQRRFIADASHELRTPVAVVRGNVGLLRRGTLPPEAREEALEMIDAESERMGRLLEDLLALARLRGPSQRAHQPLHAPTITQEVAARGAMLGDRDILVRCEGDMWVLGDPDQLEQALLNIVRNAVAHTSEGGHIELACTTTRDHVSFSVTDDGPGIPEDEIHRLFERFFRSGERSAGAGGAGLGLAITKAMVDLHEGTITAANVPPNGARFTIELPRISPPHASHGRWHS